MAASDAARGTLDEPNFARQVIGVIRRDAAQFREQLRRDPLRFGMLHAVHDAMSHGFDRREDRLRLEPVEQKCDRRAVVGGRQDGVRAAVVFQPAR